MSWNFYTSDGREKKSTAETGTYAASMYAANSGAPAHTNVSGYQKLGGGGGTLTWTQSFDIRPAGVSAQLDLTTNRRIDIRKDGLYLVNWQVSFSTITNGKRMFATVYVDGTAATIAHANSNVTSTVYASGAKLINLTVGQYLELYAWQDDSASEAYNVALPQYNFIEVMRLGPGA